MKLEHLEAGFLCICQTRFCLCHPYYSITLPVKAEYSRYLAIFFFLATIASSNLSWLMSGTNISSAKISLIANKSHHSLFNLCALSSFASPVLVSDGPDA